MTEQPVPEPTSAEATTEVEAPVTTDNSTTKVTADLLDSDAFVNRVADAVFDRMKSFTDVLTSAQEAALEIAGNMVPMDTAPAPDPNTPEPPPEADYAPQRRHRLFAQPMKRQ
jgi:hypothetical protein